MEGDRSGERTRKREASGRDEGETEDEHLRQVDDGIGSARRQREARHLDAGEEGRGRRTDEVPRDHVEAEERRDGRGGRERGPRLAHRELKGFDGLYSQSLLQAQRSESVSSHIKTVSGLV